MEVGTLYSSSDNLFKFLFVGGIVLIVMSLVFPLQKMQLIELEINSHNKDVALLNLQIDNLEKEVKQFKAKNDTTYNYLIKLSAKKNEENNSKLSKLIAEEKSKYNIGLNSLNKKQIDIQTKLTILDYNQKRIKLLKSHVTAYKGYTNWMLWPGVLIAIIGLVFWSLSTYKDEKKKSKDINS